MKWVIDTTGRFGWRPYYEPAELDNECEHIVAGFLREKHGVVRFPISTDDLTVMLEQETSDLDLFADLSRCGDDVEGVTDFFPHKKPAVRIARELSLDSAKSQRLRTTLAHEYGHVRFHSFLWNFNAIEHPSQPMMKKLARQYRRYQSIQRTFGNAKTGACFNCTRDNIFRAPFSDWMEWQAGYVCGAVLMPVSLVRDMAQKILSGREGKSIVANGTTPELIAGVATKFDVPLDAARIRLLNLGLLPDNL
jgi:hypothetical protein